MKLRRSIFAAIVCLPALCFAQSSDKGIGVEAVTKAVESLSPDLRVPNRYALIIGASEYDDGRIPDLPACANDARGLYNVLTDPTIGMFPKDNVTLLVDANVTEDSVVDAFDQLGRKVGPQDLVLVFFSGHGAVDSRGRSYWVMQDSVVDKLRATALPENEITDLLTDIQSTRLVTMIDACYSASTANLGESKSILDLQNIFPEFDGKGRIAMTASAGDQLSVVIPQGHEGYGYSAFAYHLIEGLRGKADGAAGGNREGVVTLDELWGYVKDRTESTARKAGGNQQPMLKGEFGSRFMLTVNSKVLVESSQILKERFVKLKSLFLQDVISADQYSQAKSLLETPKARLVSGEAKLQKIYIDLVDGGLKSEYLSIAINSVSIAPIITNSSPANNDRVPNAPIGQPIVVKPGATIQNSIGMDLVMLPPGQYSRGSPTTESGRKDNEQLHQVVLSNGFWMGKTEVTQHQWQQVMGYNPSRIKGDSLPVDSVTWYQASAFCDKLSELTGDTYRLPTEAQWEYACRAGSTSPFNDNALENIGWYDQNSKFAKRVAQKKANNFGLFDMHGNVAEWCADMLSPYPSSSSQPLIDPKGRVSGTKKIVRGGGFLMPASGCRSASRLAIKPQTSIVVIGFRVVRTD